MSYIEKFKNKSLFKELPDIYIEDGAKFKAEMIEFLNTVATPLIEEIKSFPVSWNNTYKKLAELVTAINFFSSNTDVNLMVFRRDEESKNLLDTITKLETFRNKDIGSNKELINQFKILSRKRNLTASQKNIINLWLEDFFENSISYAKKTKINAIQEDLIRLTNKFSENINDAENNTPYTMHIPPNKISLLGNIPTNLADIGKHNANVYGKKGLVFVPDYGTVGDILKYCKNRAIRKNIFGLFNKLNSDQRKKFNNDALLKKIIKKKGQIAKIYGFNSYSNLVLSNYTLKNMRSVNTYLTNLKTQLKPHYDSLLETCNDLAIMDNNKNFKPFDMSYYFNQLHNIYIDNKEKKFKEHYQFSSVMKKFIKLISEQFGLDIYELQNPSLEKIDSRIKVYYLKDPDTNRSGYFIFDPFNRANRKLTDEWFSVELMANNNTTKNNKNLISYITLALNGNNPDLSLDDLRCIFHEFGHSLHSFYANNKDIHLGSSKLSWDLTETPSMFMEHWIYDQKVLKRLSCHKKTKKQISNELLDNVIQHEQYFKAYEMYCDIERYQQKLLLHHDVSIFGKSINKNMNYNLSHTGILFNVARDHGMTSTHHESEYGPSEFIYMFSGGIAYQLFKRWQKQGGISNPAAAQEVFKKIINTKSNKPSAQHLSKFIKLSEINMIDFIKKGLDIDIFQAEDKEIKKARQLSIF